jgi:hypothetical protein
VLDLGQKSLAWVAPNAAKPQPIVLLFVPLLALRMLYCVTASAGRAQATTLVRRQNLISKKPWEDVPNENRPEGATECQTLFAKIVDPIWVISQQSTFVRANVDC